MGVLFSFMSFFLTFLNIPNPIILIVLFPLFVGHFIAITLFSFVYSLDLPMMIDPVAIIGLIFGIAAYALLGALVGFIVNKIKKK